MGGGSKDGTSLVLGLAHRNKSLWGLQSASCPSGKMQARYGWRNSERRIPREWIGTRPGRLQTERCCTTPEEEAKTRKDERSWWRDRCAKAHSALQGCCIFSFSNGPWNRLTNTEALNLTSITICTLTTPKGPYPRVADHVRISSR